MTGSVIFKTGGQMDIYTIKNKGGKYSCDNCHLKSDLTKLEAGKGQLILCPVCMAILSKKLIQEGIKEES